jgi:thiol-disulfide isomerase/thioredoxin
MIKSKKRLAFWAIALVLGTGLWVSKSRLQRSALQWIVLHQDTPGDRAMREMVEQSPDKAEALQKLWATGRIVPREFVGGYLRDKSILTVFSSMWPTMKPVMLEAASYGDMDTQQSALAVLEATRAAEAIPLALAMLKDVDPTIRYLALKSLQHAKDRRMMPVFIRMLDDKDIAVCGCAAGCLSEMTDEDFGARSYGDGAENVGAVAKWKTWWVGHKAKYDDVTVPEPAKWSTMPLGPASDFSLPDLDGNKVHLSDLKGKPVLLVFWTTWLSQCIEEVPALTEFQRRRGNDVVILGVTVDDLKDGETGKVHFGLEGTVNERVKKFMADHQVNYRVVIDSEGRALGPYNGGDLPVAVWIDRNGIVRRRFTGARSAKVLEAMLDSLDAKTDNNPS